MKIVGHRGLPEKYPENTLLSLCRALEKGADGVECDVQFNRDGQPYLLHDENLQRVAGRTESIGDLSANDLTIVSVHEPQRLGERFNPYPIEALEQIRPLLAEYPRAIYFVEVKPESLGRVAIADAVAQVCAVFRGHIDQLVMISYSSELLAYARENEDFRIGWVLDHYNDTVCAQAQLLRPDFLICDECLLPDTNLWHGPWQWFAYDLISPDRLFELEKLGVEWVESWNVEELLQKLADKKLADETDQ